MIGTDLTAESELEEVERSSFAVTQSLGNDAMDGKRIFRSTYKELGSLCDTAILMNSERSHRKSRYCQSRTPNLRVKVERQVDLVRFDAHLNQTLPI